MVEGSTSRFTRCTNGTDSDTPFTNGIRFSVLGMMSALQKLLLGAKASPRLRTPWFDPQEQA